MLRISTGTLSFAVCMTLITSVACNEVEARNFSRKDTVPPAIILFSLPTASTSLTVSGIVLTASDNKNVTGYFLRESSVRPLSRENGWVSVAPASYTFLSGGAKTLYAWAKDAAGNVSETRSASLTISSLPPLPLPPLPSPSPSPSITPNPTPTPSISPALSDMSFPCATPPQEAVDTSTWPEVFVGTAAQNCSDTAADAGSRLHPFCNPHLAIAKPPSAPAIITFFDGEYRLKNFPSSNGLPKTLWLTRFYNTSGSSQFLIVRAAAGARPIIVGSSQYRGGWTLYNAGSRIFRVSAENLQTDPSGLWHAIDGASALYNRTHRFDHRMKWVNGIRSHGDVSQLDADFTWTKADASGLGCPTGNTGCYLYVRLNDTSADPNAMSIEASQYGGFATIATKYVVIRGMTIRFTQSSGIYAEDANHALIEQNDLAHNANSNDNAYSMFLPFTEGEIIRNNRVFDSAYWGGVSNSKGITLMTGGSRSPIWVCNNEIFDIPGQAGVGTKGGVSNLRVIGNYIHDSYTCVETTGSRTQEGGSYGPFHPGGGWVIRDNIFERCNAGVSFSGATDVTVVQQPDLVLNNLFIDNYIGASFSYLARGAHLQNNIFLGGALSASCESSYICGTAVLFSNNAGETREMSYFLGERGDRTDHNLFHNLQRTHRIEKNWSNTRTLFDLPTFQSQFSQYDGEKGSLVVDPKLNSLDGYRPLIGSPAIGAGDPTFYPGRTSVNMGLYP